MRGEKPPGRRVQKNAQNMRFVGVPELENPGEKSCAHVYPNYTVSKIFSQVPQGV